MKRNFLLPILLLLTAAAFAQADMSRLSAGRKIDIKKADSIVFGKAQLDFAVPDVPAFKALGIDPSQILRPSSPKQFSLVVSNLVTQGFSAIPKNAAVEIAPGLITNTWYTLDQYRHNAGIRLLSKTRLSLGTDQNPSTGVNTVAFGLRTTLLDRGDFRKDTAFQQDSIYARVGALHDNIVQRLQSVKMAYGIEQYVMLSPARQAQIADSLSAVVKAETGDVDQLIAQSIATYRKLNWNATRIDVAYALLLQSPDSLVSHIKLNKHLVWATIALRPGRNNHWGQLLLGVNNATYKAEAKWYNEFTGNMRFYVGANRLKGLVEVQYQNRSHPVAGLSESLFTQLGVEANVFKGIWFQLSTGIVNALEGNNRSALKGNLNISITLPEDFRLF